MCGVGRLQVHEIRSHRLLYKEVVEAQSNCKKSYFWWVGNLVCVNSTGSYQIEKDQGLLSPRLVWGKEGEGAVWFGVCGAPLDDRNNGGYVFLLVKFI